MSKKIVSLFLALVMALSLAACVKSGGEVSQSEEGAPTKLTLGIPLSPNCTDIEDNWFTNYIEEKLNVELEFVTFSSNNTERAQQLATMVAAGEKLPDILVHWVNFDKTLSDTYGDDGYFVDLAPYFDDPNWEIAKEFQWHEKAEKQVGEASHKLLTYGNRTAEGHLYGWPSGGTRAPSDVVVNHVYINQTWLKNLGLEMPRTWEELTNVLVAFRDQDPNGNGKKDEIPMLGCANTSACYAADIPSWLLSNFEYVSDVYFFNVDENGKLYVPYITDAYRDGLRALNKLAEQGLISEMTWTIGNRTEMPGLWTPANNEAIVGVMSGYPLHHTTEGSPLVLDYVPLPPLEGAYTPIRPTTANNLTFITTDCEDLEGAMRFLMGCNEVEVMRASKFGEEGVDWKPILDENGVERVEIINDVYNQPNNKTWCWAIPGIGFQEDVNPYREYQAPVEFETLDDAGKIEWWRNNMLDMMVEANFPNLENNPEPLFFSAVYTAEEIEENGTILSEVKTFMKQQRGQFITGQLDINDDAVWQNYVDTLQSQGIGIVLENAQAAWDRQH